MNSLTILDFMVENGVLDVVMRCSKSSLDVLYHRYRGSLSKTQFYITLEKLVKSGQLIHSHGSYPIRYDVKQKQKQQHSYNYKRKKK